MRPGIGSARSRWALSVLSLCLAWSPIGVASAADSPATAPSPASSLVEGGVDSRSPDLSAVFSLTPSCSRSGEFSQVCFIDWVYLYVAAAPGQYIQYVRVEIGGQVRANFQGFFQTSMYIPAEMYAPGFAVACGQPGAGGDPLLGNLYSYVVRAAETGGNTASSTGGIHCPATLYIFVDGFGSGSTSAWSTALP